MKRLVDSRWIRARMDAKDARAQAAQKRRDAAHLKQTEVAIAAFQERTGRAAKTEKTVTCPQCGHVCVPVYGPGFLLCVNRQCRNCSTTVVAAERKALARKKSDGDQ